MQKREKLNKKIYFIRQKKDAIGGAENYLSRLVEELRKRGFSCEIITSKTPSFLASWIRALIFNTEVCLKKRGFYFSLDRIGCPEIYRAGDGVHKVFMKKKGRKLNPLNIVYLYLEKKAFYNSKLIIANSEKVKREIIESYKIDPKKIKVIYNGIKIESFNEEESKRKIVNEFALDSGKKIILFVGSGFERKGVDRFLKILSLVKEDFYAFVVGKEKRMKFYVKLAEKFGLKNHIFFTGVRKDVKDFYAASDIFLFPPKYEPFSNVVLEAMSYKNAVFTTDDNGACEILDKDFIIHNQNDKKIALLIERMIENEKFLNEIKNKNFKIAKNFTIEKNAEESIKAIESVLKA